MVIAPYLAQALIATAISAAISLLFSETSNIEGQRLDNLSPIGSAYGAPIYRVSGKMRVPGNVIWSRPLREVRTSTEQGGKGGGGATVTTSSYYGTFAVLVCAGVMRRPIRIWADKKIIWEAPGAEIVAAADISSGGSFEFFPGNETQLPSSIIEATLGARTPAYRDRCYVVFSEIPVGTYGNRLPSVEVEVESELNGDIADVIIDMCKAAGIDEGRIDASDISIAVHGTQFSPGSAKEALQQIMSGIGIQCIYDGSKLAFRNFTRSSQYDVPEEDLLASDTGVFVPRRVREAALPKTVNVTHIDPARDYQSATQSRSRQSVSSVQVTTITSPIAMAADFAAQLCDTLLYRSWLARTQYDSFGLPPKYLFLEPGDVVRIQVRNRMHSIRLRTISVGANGALACTGEAYDASVYTGAGEGDSGEFPGQQLPSFGTTTFKLLDAPAVTDAEASFVGYRLAATGSGKSWRSAVLEESPDGGASWRVVGQAKGYSTMGPCDTILPAPPVTVGACNFDYASALDVTLIRGELSSAGTDQLYAGANLCMVGNEVIQFAFQEYLGDRKYRLTGLLRGRNGTEHEMGAHEEGEQFVVLSETAFIQIPVSQVGQTRTYRVTPVGSDTGVTDTFACTGASVKTWSPAMFRATRDEIGNILISWARRSRIGTELPNDGDIPLDEPTEGYILEIYDDETLLRSITTSDPAHTYTIAQQLEDFGVVQSAVKMMVYQTSQLLGRGYPSIATL